MKNPTKDLAGKHLQITEIYVNLKFRTEKFKFQSDPPDRTTYTDSSSTNLYGSLQSTFP